MTIEKVELGHHSEYNFTIALDRPHIPRGGFYSDADNQLSVAPHPRLPRLLPPEGVKNQARDIFTLWEGVLYERMQRNYIVPIAYETLSPTAFGPTTEQLFKKFIVPAIKKHCGEAEKNLVAVDNVSYLLPFWNKSELEPFKLVEGELARLIKDGGKLPDGIGAVFLDFPPNQQKKDNQYNTDELLKFIQRHPDVIFIIDQANLYFSKPFLKSHPSFQDDLMFTGITYYKQDPIKRLQDDNLVLVTNTTTKAQGISGFAVAAGTARTRAMLGQDTGTFVPAWFSENDDLVDEARISLFLDNSFNAHPPVDKQQYDARDAEEFRSVIIRNKERLISHLQSLFGESVTCPELITEGARILINANELGFGSAQDLCDALYQYFSIATKPATVYVSPKKEKEWGKYVQMTIPWNDKMLSVVLDGFEKLHKMNKNKLLASRVI